MSGAHNPFILLTPFAGWANDVAITAVMGAVQYNIGRNVTSMNDIRALAPSKYLF